MTPTAITWTGGGDGSTFEDAANWDSDSVPGAGADVIIGPSVPVVTINSDAALNSLQAASSVQVNGSLTLASASSMSQGFLQVSGSLALGAGADFDLFGNGEFDGAVQLGSGSQLTLHSGMFGFGATTVTGAGLVRVTDGSTGFIETTPTVQNLSLEAGASLTGTGTLTITGSLDWSGGTMGWGGVTQIAAGATATLDGPDAKQLNGWTLAVAGTATWSAGDLTGQQGVLDVQTGGDFEVQGDRTWSDYAATLNVAGTLRTTGAGATATLDSTLTSTGTIDVEDTLTTLDVTLASGSTLTGAGTFISTGMLDWTGGTMNGTGVTQVAMAATIEGTDAKELDDRTLLVTGYATWQQGDIWSSAGVLDVQDWGYWVTQGTVNWWDRSGTSRIDVEGTFQVTGAGSQVTLAPAFNNNGETDVEGGDMTLNGGGDWGGTFFVAAGATVQMANGLFNAQGAAAAAGMGQVQIGGAGNQATLRVAANQLNVQPTVQLQAGGTINGGGTLAVTSLMEWTGGVMAGNGTTGINNGATLIISGDDAKTLDGRSLGNDGVVTLAGKDLVVNGAIITNTTTGVINLRDDVSLLNGQAPSQISNTGLFTKSGGNPGAGRSVVQPDIENLGTVSVAVGLLVFSGNFSQIGASAVIDITTGAEMWTAQLQFGGGGVQGGGTLRIDSDQGGATATIQGAMTIDAVDVINAGTATWAGGTISLANGAEIDNLPGAVFEVRCDSTMTTTAGTAIFRNWGLFHKTVGAGGVVTTLITTDFNNQTQPNQPLTALVQVDLGVLELRGNGYHTAPFVVAGATALEFGAPGKEQILDAGTSFSGAGTFYLNTLGTMIIAAGATVQSSGTFAMGVRILLPPPALQFGGFLSGAGEFRNTGQFTWSMGNITDLAQLTNASQMTLNGISLKTLDSSLVVNQGTLTWTGGGDIRMSTRTNAGRKPEISNAGTLDIQNDQVIQLDDPLGTGALIRNEVGGIVQKSGGAGTTTIQVPFLNEGTVALMGRALTFQDSLYQDTDNAQITVTGGTFTVGAAFTQVAGSVDVGGGVMTVSGGYALAGGWLTLGAGAGGTLDVPQDLTVSGPGSFYGGGTINGNVTQQAGAGGISLGGAQLVVMGDLDQVDGQISLGGGLLTVIGACSVDGGSFNLAGGTLEPLQGLTIGALGTLLDGGTIEGDVTTSGIITMGYSGGTKTLAVSGNFTQTAGGSLNLAVDYLGLVFAWNDQVTVGGTATLGGRLWVYVTSSFNPQPGDSYTLLSYTQQVGAFDSTGLPTLPAGLTWNTQLNNTSLVVTVQ